jgi:hypothetical protein
MLQNPLADGLPGEGSPPPSPTVGFFYAPIFDGFCHGGASELPLYDR